MNKNLGFITFIVITILVGIAIPKVIYQDAKNVSHSEIKIAKEDAYDVLEHPLDFLQIMKLVVREKNQEKIYLDAYTFFGLRYAVVEIDIDPEAGRTIYRSCPSEAYFILTNILRCQ